MDKSIEPCVLKQIGLHSPVLIDVLMYIAIIELVTVMSELNFNKSLRRYEQWFYKE